MSRRSPWTQYTCPQNHSSCPTVKNLYRSHNRVVLSKFNLLFSNVWTVMFLSVEVLCVCVVTTFRKYFLSPSSTLKMRRYDSPELSWHFRYESFVLCTYSFVLEHFLWCLWPSDRIRLVRKTLFHSRQDYTCAYLWLSRCETSITCQI